MSKEKAVTGTSMLSPGALQWPPLEVSVQEDEMFYFSRGVMGWGSSYPTSCFLSSPESHGTGQGGRHPETTVQPGTCYSQRT